MIALTITYLGRRAAAYQSHWYHWYIWWNSGRHFVFSGTRDVFENMPQRTYIFFFFSGQTPHANQVKGLFSCQLVHQLWPKGEGSVTDEVSHDQGEAPCSAQGRLAWDPLDYGHFDHNMAHSLALYRAIFVHTNSQEWQNILHKKPTGPDTLASILQRVKRE